MLGEDFEEEPETNHRNLFKQKKNIQDEEYLEYSTKKSKDGKKDKEKRHSKKYSCENCKALKQKINELEQLNEELLKIKEKLSKKNDELTQKNEELTKNKNEIVNKNNELLTKNKQLKEENNKLINKNNELIEEKNGYKTEISGLKKQLIVKINELSSISKEKDKSTSSNNNINANKKDETKNSTVNVDIISLNSDSNTPKKEEINNTNKYCTLEDYNELKLIVEELSSRINELEKWKKNMIINDKPKRKSKDRKITSIEKSDKNETLSRHKSSKTKKKKESIDKLSKSLIIKQNSIIDNNSGSNNTNTNDAINGNNKNENNNIVNKSFSKNKIKNKEIEKKNNNNQRFNSKIITDVEDLDLIARGLVKDELDSLKNLRVGYKLIYRASDNGEEAEDFHERCDDFEGSLTLIKTKEGNIFGGYTSLSWDFENESEKKDEFAFVFSLNLEKLYFESNKKDYSIFCDKNKGPCFVGMFAIQEHILTGKSYINPWGIQCFSGEDSPFEINGGKTEFNIEELEVFQVIVKRN